MIGLIDRMKNSMPTIFLCILSTAFDDTSVKRVVPCSLGEEHHPKLQHSSQLSGYVLNSIGESLQTTSMLSKARYLSESFCAFNDASVRGPVRSTSAR